MTCRRQLTLEHGVLDRGHGPEVSDEGRTIAAGGSRIGYWPGGRVRHLASRKFLLACRPVEGRAPVIRA